MPIQNQKNIQTALQYHIHPVMSLTKLHSNLLHCTFYELTKFQTSHSLLIPPQSNYHTFHKHIHLTSKLETLAHSNTNIHLKSSGEQLETDLQWTSGVRLSSVTVPLANYYAKSGYKKLEKLEEKSGEEQSREELWIESSIYSVNASLLCSKRKKCFLLWCNCNETNCLHAAIEAFKQH